MKTIIALLLTASFAPLSGADCVCTFDGTEYEIKKGMFGLVYGTPVKKVPPNPTPTPTATPKATATPTITPAPTPTVTATVQPTATPSASPTPTPPVSAVKLPHGIISIVGADDYITSNNPRLNRPEVNGFRLRLSWKELEPKEGQYNLQPIKDSIALAASKGKNIGISVSAGIYCPTWLEAAGAKFNTVQTTIGQGDPGTGRMPWPWDPVFLTKWEKFNRALGKEIDGSPNLRYIPMGGMGQVMESYVATSADDVVRFNADGGLPKWIEAGKKITKFFTEAYPHTAVILTIAKPRAGGDAVTAVQTLSEWIATTYPKHAGFMDCSWNAKSSEVYAMHVLVKKYSPTNPTGLQQTCSAQLAGGCDFEGTLAEGITAALKLGPPWYLEIYQADFIDSNKQIFLNASGQLRSP